MKKNLFVLILMLFLFISGCYKSDVLFPPLEEGQKITLWRNGEGTKLRGANIYQRRVYSELDGDILMGSEFFGPLYTQGDFDMLSQMGANYVNISHPGIFSEKPPYELDGKALENLVSIINMTAAADLFAVVSFRTGPGRSEFSILRDGLGVWFDESYLNEEFWYDPEAQDAWVIMWETAANILKFFPNVVGYDLMVEPNSNELAGIWDYYDFLAQYSKSLFDWNQIYPKIVDAVRRKDTETPILIGANGYSSVNWIFSLDILNVPNLVYTAHQYEPFYYTHQEPYSEYSSFPQQITPNLLKSILNPLKSFLTRTGQYLAVNEFGVMRFIPGADEFLDNEIGFFEENGINWAIWLWECSWEPYQDEVSDFNFMLGPDPDNLTQIQTSEQIEVIKRYWAKNSIRPSGF